MRPVLAASGYLVAMLWCVCCFLALARSQYCWGVIRFCAGRCVFGDSSSNVSTVGIGLLSRASSDVCMLSQKVFGFRVDGACLIRASVGVMASCSA